DMLDMVVIAESTPGVIAVNSATFCGYRVGGFWGGIIATLGVVLPSYAVICALSFILDIAFENFWVMAAFRGVRACVAVLIFNAFLKMFKQVPKNIFTMSIAVIAFTLVAFFNINTIFVLLGAAIVGVVYCAIVSSRKKKLTTETSADKLLPSATEIEESSKKDEASTKEDKR
ncbi:MAG: chromate transporter, partial [Clostridia bacterium]